MTQTPVSAGDFRIPVAVFLSSLRGKVHDGCANIEIEDGLVKDRRENTLGGQQRRVCKSRHTQGWLLAPKAPFEGGMLSLPPCLLLDSWRSRYHSRQRVCDFGWLLTFEFKSTTILLLQS